MNQFDSKLCPLSGTRQPANCGMFCKFGVKVLTDEQVKELKKNIEPIIQYECELKLLIHQIHDYYKGLNDGRNSSCTKTKTNKRKS